MQSIHETRKGQFIQFTSWVGQHITGDEKGEAHLFLDRLFQAFGHKGLKEAGGILEMRVRNDAGGTAFADLVWKPIVLVEMKKRGTDLRKHYRQAFDYWTHLVPGRPRYVVLCNFDEFWVYDFETQMDTPVDQLKLVNLSERYGPLAFLFPIFEKPTFGNDQQAVTREAANLLASCFNRLVKRGIERSLAQRFVLQMLVALFSEDIGLLKKYLVAQLLDECREPRNSYDLIGGLFVEMNTPGITSGGRFKGVDYFNGGLFANPARVDLESDELDFLKEASKADWSQVRPEIFGTLFEHSLDQKERHAFGAHFTSPADIMKIVGPTIVEPWKEQIESAKTLKRLSELRIRMMNYTVLDPACGSGNFLYIAYRELKRLEYRLNERLTEMSAKQLEGQTALGLVTADKFFGIDINHFAVELAKVTMMIARKLAIDELHITEHALPLQKLDANFLAEDALILSDGSPAKWPAADVIIGNPPFLGAKRLKPERGAVYVKAVRGAYDQLPGMADYCVYWFRKAHDHLSQCTISDPFTGRAGLVGTQNIRNNKSRVGGLDYILQTGTIVEAIDNQPWSGEANVHVSIVNWVKSKDHKLIPSMKRLWTQLNKSGTRLGHESRATVNGPINELVFRDVPVINSSLSDETDVSKKARLSCNLIPKRCFQGKIPGYDGFLLDKDTADRFRIDSGEVIFPYLTGRELLDKFKIERWIIDFGKRDILSASAFPSAFAHCQKNVLPAVEQTVKNVESADSDMKAARKEHFGRWWQLWNRRDELSKALNLIPRYIGCSRVTRRPIMVFLSSKICPSDLVQVFAFSDDYSYGILQSTTHFEWFRKSSRMKVESDTRYSVRDVFETFPWPQSPSIRQIEAIALASRRLRDVRAQILLARKEGLRDIYRILELPGKHPLRTAHEELDAAVRQAYGMDKKERELSFLLELNSSVEEAIRLEKPFERPGIPSCLTNSSPLISADCFSD